MPTYRVVIEASLDVDAENEDAAKIEALTKLEPSDFIAWLINEQPK